MLRIGTVLPSRPTGSLEKRVELRDLRRRDPSCELDNRSAVVVGRRGYSESHS